MADLQKIVYLSKAQYETLVQNGTITVGDVTITYSSNDLYVIPEQQIPNGGTTGQVLTKASNTDLDTVWATPSGQWNVLYDSGTLSTPISPTDVSPSGSTVYTYQYSLNSIISNTMVDDLFLENPKNIKFIYTTSYSTSDGSGTIEHIIEGQTDLFKATSNDTKMLKISSAEYTNAITTSGLTNYNRLLYLYRPDSGPAGYYLYISSNSSLSDQITSITILYS